jgi:hypothetical protein
MGNFDKLLATTILTVAAAACGGASSAPPAAPTTAGSAAPADGSSAAAPAPAASTSAVEAPSAWSTTMPKEAQIAFMKKNVAPRMAKVFQGADAKRYAEFGCKTCHGPDFKTPKDFLPHLSMKDGKMSAFADKPEVAKFMAEHVVPEMASALGEQPYNPQTKQGFGCHGCHEIDMK